MVDAARVGGSVPSYLHSLTLLGQYLNKQHASRPVIAEVDSGFLLIFFQNGRWTTASTVPVHHTELLELSEAFSGSTLGKHGVLLKGGDTRDKKNALCPMGFDAFFRALGYRLDRRSATGVTICETRECFYVSYWVDKATFVIREGRRQPVSTVQLETYDAGAVKELLASTYDQLSQEMNRYKRSLDLDPHDHLSMLRAAFMFEDDGNYREAEALLVRIVSAVPEHPEAHYQLARLALMRGDKRGALASIKKAVQFKPDDPAVHDLHGRILRQDAMLEDAIRCFERALELDAGNGIYHLHLSKAYESAGRHEEALAQLALSASQTAAPAWDMVQDDVTIVVRPAQPAPAEDLASHSAPSSQEVAAASPVLTTLTTTFDSYDSTLPSAEEQAPDNTHEVPLPHPQEPAPKRLQDLPAATAAPPSRRGPALTTLEQRLRAAQHASQHAALPKVILPPLPNEVAPSSLPSHGDAPLPHVESPRGQQAARAPDVGAMPAAPAAATPATNRPATPSGRAAPGEAPEPRGAAEPPPAQPFGQPADTNSGAVELAAEVLNLQRMLDVDPGRADLHRKLGFLLARQGKTAEAAAAFRRALQASRANL